MVQLETASRENLIARTGQWTPEALLALGIGPNPTDPTQVSVPEQILYLRVANMRLGLKSLNSAMSRYSLALIDLASPELVGDKDIDDLTTTLNENIRSASVALGADKAATKEAAVVSTFVGEGLKTYLRSRQRKDLIAAMEKNQPVIERTCKHANEAVSTSILVLRGIYQTDYRNVVSPLTPKNDADLARINAMSDQDRKKIAAQILDLNDEYLHRIQALQDLNAVYETLPTAHAQLIRALKTNNFDLSTVVELLERGIRLGQTYETLRAKPLPEPK